MLNALNLETNSLHLGGSSSQNLVFIDGVLGQNSILSSSFKNAEVFWLDPNLNGVAQITNVLAEHQNVASVHIVSHGSAGDVLLGNSHLNFTNISSYSSDLQRWSNALTNDADVLFYGCNVGAGADGLTFVQQLSQITGADIAASNDLTGNATLGGDWELEVNTGAIESSSVLDTQAIAQYQSILPIYNGKNYILTNGSKTWEQAQAEAQSFGGNLVTINDAAEEAWLRQTFGTTDRFWIGLTDKDVEGQFKWVNGEAVTYTNWAPGEPNNWGGNENYAAMNSNSSGKWNDRTGTSVARGIIEIDPKIYNGKKYFLTNGTKTWEQAQAEAQSFGGNLVTINDAAEETWLKQTFGTTQQLWIGLTDKDVEGQFKWVNGEATTYINWAPGEPNNWGGNEDYAAMNWGSTGKWNDLPSTFVRRGIIEVAPASIALVQNTYTLNEVSGSLVIGVVRSNDTTDEATVQYRVDSGTALANSDFTATSGTLTFAVGETYKTFTIPIIDDTVIEGNETLSVVIESPTGADLGTIRTASITLIDDESTVLTISEPQVNENAGNAIITLTRSNGIGTATVDFATVDGSAITGSDYQATSGQVTFADGETSQTIAIGLINDTIGEPDETFKIEFTNPVGVTLDSSLTTVTIIDDDPGSFIQETFISGLTQPTAFVRTPDNSLMYILEKSGIIKVAQGNTVLATRFIDLRQDVNNVRDRGALGLAIHPQFLNGSPYIYVAYTYDPPEAYLNTNPNTTLDDPDRNGNRPARVVRITADAANGYRTAVANSQEVILGKNSTWANTSRPDGNSTTDFSIPESGRTTDGGYVQDYIKTDSESHTIGQLAFGADGALYVSIGDGTSYNGLDARTASVLNPDSLSGKILRVDPLTGQGLADNPFFNGNPNSNRSKVWNLGLRNPFRFNIQPGTSTPFIGDVGWTRWEEVNIGTSGANFGWPAYEGGTNTNGNLVNLRQTSYDAANIPAIEALYTSGEVVTAPIYARSHTAGARAIIMGDFYDGNTFPSVYNDGLFIADVNEGTVDVLTLDSENRVTAVRRFASGIPGIVYMETGPDGNLYYVNLVNNSIARWRPA